MSQTKARKKPGVVRFFEGIAEFFTSTVKAFVEGDIFVKLSALLCGTSCFARKQYLKGFFICLIQAAIMLVFPTFFFPYMSKLSTLGTVQQKRVFNPETMKNEFNDYDNSFLILLFGVLGVVLLITAVILWMRNLRNAREVELTAKSGKHVNTFRDDLNDALDRKFHRTLLTLPVLGVVLFTIIPLIVMILIGFTNYDRNHLPPSKLFTWVGLDNFTRLTALTADSSFGYAFTRVLVWTLVWAVLATFTCYIGGILMAMFINNRNTKGKKFWRTCFMVAMAVPQFVSLLLVRNFFADLGIVNTICKNIGLTDWLYSIGAIPTANFIPFLTHPAWARPMIILINIWVGIPYQMLIATGILMNIPTELIEAAKIDGANAWQSFKSITMPYILFITGPSLVNSLVANINNFNVIWLLSRDVYTTSDQLMAMFINNRNTKGKKFWRTCFMVAMAVPQFVSLLLVRNFFADLGIVNTICKNIGLTDWLYSIGAIPTANFIPFLTHPAWARPMIILINIWVGIPYQMLIATGILMNIPTELIEAAKIDGANAWQSFKSITMPYILFITGPSLVNSLVANINNFNVIWLLSRDVYTTSDQLMANANANEVDLLVTWLYRLTQDQSNYKMASVIGILVFVVCAILTLVAFSRMIKGDKEESFQ